MGRCAPISLLAPGPSSIASTSRRSDDAPPEGRPCKTGNSYARGVSDINLERSSIDGVTDRDVGDGGAADTTAHAEVISREVERGDNARLSSRSTSTDKNLPVDQVTDKCIEMEPHCNAVAMELSSTDSARETRSTTITNKCKGMYRIKVKGAACHGRACCGGT